MLARAAARASTYASSQTPTAPASRRRFVSSDRLELSARSVRDVTTSPRPESHTIARAIARRALEVVAGAVRDLAEHDLLADAAAEQHDDPRRSAPRASTRKRSSSGSVQPVAERAAARDDRDLVHGHAAAEMCASSACPASW